jgi:aspartyl-tRNA(Asn)/glutamyl-tRNA(Gln) amidotransferase subunit A
MSIKTACAVENALFRRCGRKAAVPMDNASETDLCYLSASELVKRYERRSLSPVEVTAAVLARISRLDPHVNAFVLVDNESAMKSARQSEKRWSKGKSLGLVDGVPTAIKDLVLAKGWPTLRGSKSTIVDQPWEEDAPATARLREQGAILLGKTTTAEFGSKAVADCPLTGITRNPWNPAVTPGGSSGGSGAGAAFGFGQLHVATDGGGSGRLPAAHCGVFGFKQTFGRVSSFPYAPNLNLQNVTPMTRTVRDAALLLDVIGQPDPQDWYALPLPPGAWQKGLDDGIRGLRVAFSPDLGYAKVDPEIARVVAAAVNTFADLGCVVDQADPGIEDPFPIFRAIWAVSAAKLSRALGARVSLTERGFQEVAEEGRSMDAVAVFDTIERRELLGRQLMRFHRNWDILITPMAAELPPTIVDLTREANRTHPVSAFAHMTPFAYPFNLTHQPAASIPCGVSSTGLPVGLQIVGPKYADSTVLRAARAFEKARSFEARPFEP